EVVPPTVPDTYQQVAGESLVGSEQSRAEMVPLPQSSPSGDLICIRELTERRQSGNRVFLKGWKKLERVLLPSDAGVGGMNASPITAKKTGDPKRRSSSDQHRS